MTDSSSQNVFSFSLPLACAALGAGLSLGCSAKIDGFVSLGNDVGGSGQGGIGAAGDSLAGENGTGGSGGAAANDPVDSTFADTSAGGSTAFGSGSGGTAFGSGSGGTASADSSSSTGGTSGLGDTGIVYSTTGCGTGSPAGYSSCSWTPAGDIARSCGYPEPPSDFHGLVFSLRTCTPLNYLIILTPTQDCYRNGVTLDVPVLTSETPGVSISPGQAGDTPGVFQYALHSTEPIEQRSWTNIHVKLSITCRTDEPAVSAEGDCGWGRYY